MDQESLCKKEEYMKQYKKEYMKKYNQLRYEKTKQIMFECPVCKKIMTRTNKSNHLKGKFHKLVEDLLLKRT